MPFLMILGLTPWFSSTKPGRFWVLGAFSSGLSAGSEPVDSDDDRDAKGARTHGASQSDVEHCKGLKRLVSSRF